MAQVVDHRDLIATFEPGNLPASERIVRVYQNEILRTSFLLTGTADGAVLLAREGFLRYFRRLVRGEPGEDPRLDLLEETGKRFLADPVDEPDENGDGPQRTLEGTVAYDTGPDRYRVEDDRSRVISLLGLLDRKTRLGVVLRDFNALEEEPVCRIVDETPYTLRQQLHPARERIRDAAGVGPDHSVRELLVNTATSAPRPNLWPEVLGPLEDFYAEEDERRQRLTYLAAGVVGLILLLVGLWLFDLLPFLSDGDDSGAAIAPTAGPTATPTATPEPTITPTPIPELSSFAIPQGNVPARMLMGLGSFSGSSVGRSEYGYFDIESATYEPLPLNSFPTPSPDGRVIIGYRTDDATAGNEQYSLVAIDSETGELRWEAALPSTLYDIEIVGDRVYMALLEEPAATAEEQPAPELRAYALDSGDVVETWDDVIPELQTGISSFVDVMLFASPDGQRLFIALEEFDSSPTLVSSRTLASFSLPDMTFESSSIQSDSTASRQFPADFNFDDAYVTPDGAFIYRVNAEEETVQFRSSDLSADLDLPMPFVQERADNELIQWTASNNGRYLYVLANQRAEVVIVDLLARRIDRIFPLAFSDDIAGQADLLRGDRPIGIGYAAGLSISQDGRTLYLVTISVSSSGDIEQSHSWTVDLETWTVTSVETVPGFLIRVSEFGDRLTLMVNDQPGTASLVRRLATVDPVSGEVLTEFRGEGLPEWSESFFSYSLRDLYQLRYARAPAEANLVSEQVDAASTLPRLSVVATAETIPAGMAFDVAARILNPADGQRLTEEMDSVRFDGDSTVILRLIHERGLADDEILIANRADFGDFRANTALLEPGFWDAEVTITGIDGTSWSFTLDKVFEIVPSWEATDGRRYVLDVDTDPNQPQVDQETTITARFVEVDSGAPMPAGVEVVGGFPEMVRIVFDSDGAGVANVTLLVGENGVYAGEEVFWQAGEWQVSVNIRDERGERYDIDAGTVTVVE